MRGGEPTKKSISKRAVKVACEVFGVYLFAPHSRVHEPPPPCRRAHTGPFHISDRPEATFDEIRVLCLGGLSLTSLIHRRFNAQVSRFKIPVRPFRFLIGQIVKTIVTNEVSQNPMRRAAAVTLAVID
jgi:hypothetical protein